MGKKMFSFRNPYIYLVALLFIGFKGASFWRPTHVKQIAVHSHKKTVWLNVFVHGIMSIKPHLSWNNFMLFMKDKIEGTLYERTVKIMRDDPFFFKNQAMQHIGFKRVNPDLTAGDSSATLAFILEEIEHHYGIQNTNLYYTYGWSGLLSPKRRYQDAINLFTELEQEVKRLKDAGYEPKVRIFGYSHGGNVALNLAAVHHKNFPKSSLIIDELVLLGTPIISDTDYLINDPMFKQVFNLYSTSDRIQIMDLFAPNQFFSGRTFKSRSNFKLPDKLIQIKLKVTRCKNNIHSSSKRFGLSHNYDNPTVVLGKKSLLRDISPGHVELWFFGWTPIHYRDSFPLNPLPIIAFAPVILHHAHNIAHSNNPEHSIVADIRPQHNVILFRKLGNMSIHSTVPYISKEKLAVLERAVLDCKPHLYSDDIYKAHIEDAVKSARKNMEPNTTTDSVDSIYSENLR